MLFKISKHFTTSKIYSLRRKLNVEFVKRSLENLQKLMNTSKKIILVENHFNVMFVDTMQRTKPGWRNMNCATNKGARRNNVTFVLRNFGTKWAWEHIETWCTRYLHNKIWLDIHIYLRIWNILIFEYLQDNFFEFL